MKAVLSDGNDGYTLLLLRHLPVRLQRVDIYRDIAQHIADTGLRSGLQQLVVKLQSPCQLAQDLVIRHRLAERFDHRLGPLRMAAPKYLEFTPLEG